MIIRGVPRNICLQSDFIQKKEKYIERDGTEVHKMIQKGSSFRVQGFKIGKRKKD